jgi:DNA-binding SARP family transcriptional activator
VKFGILGRLEVVGDVGRLEVGGSRRRLVLSRLLVDANRVVPTGRLVEDVWSGSPPPGAAQTLRSHLASLRRALGAGRVAFRGSGYCVVVEPGELDAAVFEAAVVDSLAALARAETARGLAGLDQALGLWRGPALVEVADEPWAMGVAARLDELRQSAVESALDARLILGGHREVVGLAKAALAEHPLRERLWGQLMLALYRCGRQAEALRAYQRLRTTLGEELGIAPSAELVALEE